jgi:hypothetical protein
MHVVQSLDGKRHGSTKSSHCFFDTRAVVDVLAVDFDVDVALVVAESVVAVVVVV